MTKKGTAAEEAFKKEERKKSRNSKVREKERGEEKLVSESGSN